MRHCNHDNVLKLIDVDVDPERENFTDLLFLRCCLMRRYMTMELMETDLNRVIYSNQVLTDDHIQFFTYQIFRGLKYLGGDHPPRPETLQPAGEQQLRPEGAYRIEI